MQACLYRQASESCIWTPWPLFTCHTLANNGKGTQWGPRMLHACCAAVLCMLCYACCAAVLCVLCYACCAAVLCVLCCCAMHAVLLCYARCAAALCCCDAVLCMLCIAGVQKDSPPIARHLPERWLHQWAAGIGHTAAQMSPDACCDPNAVMLGSSTAHSCCLLPAHQNSCQPVAENLPRDMYLCWKLASLSSLQQTLADDKMPATPSVRI